MGKILGEGEYRYEAVEEWFGINIPGIASDVAIDSGDRVYVATRTEYSIDNRKGTILVFDRNGKFLNNFAEDNLVCPHHIWISPEDEIFLADNWDHVVRKYNTAGELLKVIGIPGQPGLIDQPFNQPTGAIIAPICGDIFVSDGYRQSRIHRFSPDGELKLSWGSGEWKEFDFVMFGHDPTPGTGPGEFKLPHGIIADKNDRIYVMDRENDRIQVFDVNGAYQHEWSITRPCQSFIDGDDIIHSASLDGQIYVNRLDGELICSWGSIGTESWQFTGPPHGLCIDSHGDMYVGQVMNPNGLNKFART